MFPVNEAERLAALRALAILDTLPKERFDRITAFARELFQVPIALISLIDHDRRKIRPVASQGCSTWFTIVTAARSASPTSASSLILEIRYM